MAKPDSAVSIQEPFIATSTVAAVHVASEIPQSARMWGFALRDVLPHKLSADGVVAVPGELQRIGRFLGEQFAMFTEESQGSTPNHTVSARKLEYLRDACDLIELRHADETVGVFVGAPEDWSSYYVRMFAVRRDFQRPSVIRRFVRECLFTPLAEHAVERISAETSPANIAMSHLFTELHFHATGHHLSDRWGPMIRYTRFLSAACEEQFLRKFGAGAPADSPRKNEELEA
jgi:hypothetical protein